ncbi:MAG: LptF/LptG family permease [Pseudomonadota bacterium]
MTLHLYFAKRFFVHFLLIAAAIGLLAFIVNFLDAFGGTSTPSPVFSALRETVLATPTFMVSAMPLLVMLGGLSFALSLSRSSEFVISRAAGQSVLKSLMSPATVAFLIGLFSIFFFDPIAGQLDRRLQLQKATPGDQLQVKPTGFWVRQSDSTGIQIIKALGVENNGTRLRDVTVLDHDTDGRMKRRIYAPIGLLQNDILTLTQGTEWTGLLEDDAGLVPARQFAFRRIPTVISPAQFVTGFAAPETLTPIGIPSTLRALDQAGFSSLPHRAHLMQQISRPFLFATMLFLGAAFLLQSQRFQRLEIAALSALMFGFSLHFLQNFAKTLGSSGEIPLWVAAWSPILAAIAGVLTFFLYTEDG